MSRLVLAVAFALVALDAWAAGKFVVTEYLPARPRVPGPLVVPEDAPVDVSGKDVSAALDAFLGAVETAPVEGSGVREVLVRMQPPENGRCGWCEEQERQFGTGWTAADGTVIRVRYVTGGAAAYPQVELPDCPERVDRSGKRVPLFWNYVPRANFESALRSYPPERGPVGITVGTIPGGKKVAAALFGFLNAVGPVEVSVGWKFQKKPQISNNGTGIQIPKDGSVRVEYSPDRLHVVPSPEVELTTPGTWGNWRQPVSGILVTPGKLTVELPGLTPDISKTLGD